MTKTNLTCGQFDELLSDYFEGTSEPAVRSAMDVHRVACLRCAALVRDIERVRVDAEALPELTPSRDLWAGISERIDQDVVAAPAFGVSRGTGAHSQNQQMRRAISVRQWSVAAAILVAVTSGVTYFATMAHVRQLGAPGPIAVLPEQGDSVATIGLNPPASTPTDDSTATRPATPATGAATAIPASTRAGRVPATVTYDREIAGLRDVLEQRRLELDPSTVAVIQHSLTTIDIAIQDARRALASDPSSTFLNEQLDKALEKKLGLLRRVALLPARA